MNFLRNKLKLKYYHLITLGFAGIILFGALLLMTPLASQSGQWTSFLDALFTSTSSVCVTGLVVHDTATYWSFFGQLVIIILIQIGGLGIVTVITSIALITGRKIGYFARSTLANSISISAVGGIVRLTHFIFKITFAVEGFFAILMSFKFIPDFGLVKGIWYSIFHSISAFCNAGFDLMGVREQYSSLVSYVSNPLINISIMLLIVIGGLSFSTWADIKENKLNFHRYHLQSKIILSMTAILIIFPAIYFFIVDFAGMPLGTRILASLFQSVTPRTAGFNTVDLTKMSESSILLQIILMLIGAAPGSTGGGMKVTTFFVMFKTSIAIFENSKRSEGFGRTIPENIVRNAATIFMLYIGLCIGSAMILSVLENIPILTAMYETASAIATVGLTLGITRDLCSISRIILIILMFAGRVGGLTLIYGMFPFKKLNLGKKIEENVAVG
ncbi:MAG: potassium transporter TrkG [Bulleidia sp.]|nr:potassium transporter TrkG [Bulleidia sp.]